MSRQQSGQARRSGHGRRSTIVAAVVLVLSLSGWGWFASEQAREAWWAFGQNVAVGPDGQGWASLDTVSVRLDGADTVPIVDEEAPPDGFEFLALDFTVDAATPTELSTCEVQVRDTQGRLFLAGAEVPRDDAFDSSLMCGTSDPEEDPVPASQSVLVLVPVDAALDSVRVDAREFPPAEFIELPVP
ncbi:hypothetical protein NF556_01450 [Ornithinimicrobium faecis]|uniref:Ribosomally synthesized peptide with SipW-like signal peptide n=1 Tax=Ornithinimicrobium faecis TaxID=2934158 RepID=A0ABY4YUT3_9MICO|nr:hypothetical protein [Ornithinimicrobium sp. HY1793]USQ80357.1 hypothetical protein NF556_01450 [Ornithinimicrobium sp. HY1793]